MRNMYLSFFLGLMVFVPGLLADGDSRPATQSEKEFSVSVLQTLEKAVPAVPADWVIEQKSEVIATDRATVDAEKYPFQVEYQQAWQHPQRLEEYRIREDQLIAEMAASMQSDQKSLDEKAAQMNALAEEFAKALEKSDSAEVARIQARMEELGNQLNAYGESQNKALEAREREIKPKDARVRFSYRINALNFDVSWFERDGEVAGLPAYRREFDDANASMEGEYVVFAGDFSPKAYEGSTWMELKTDPAVPSTSVQSIILVVAGDRTHTRQLIESMDWVSLKKLIKN